MTQEQKDKAYQWAEGFLKSQLFGAAYRLLVLFMMVIGGPLLYFAITSTYNAVLAQHDQIIVFQGQITRVIDQADNDRRSVADQFKAVNDRVTQVSQHADKMQDTMERDFARKDAVKDAIGYEDRRIDKLEGRPPK